MEFGGGGFFETFLEGSVDHIIYRDGLVNRRFFIYCCLASAIASDQQTTSKKGEGRERERERENTLKLKECTIGEDSG